jgi:hypothetical protein
MVPARALIFLGLYRRRRLAGLQNDTARLIAQMVAAVECATRAEYIAALPDSCDLNVRNYNYYGQEIIRSATCYFHEYLQIMRTGPFASTVRYSKPGGEIIGHFSIGTCIQLHTSGTTIYGRLDADPMVNNLTPLATAQGRFWKFRGRCEISSEISAVFAIVAMNRQYYILALRGYIVVMRSAPATQTQTNIYSLKCSKPEGLRLDHGDFIVIDSAGSRLTLRFCQYKVAPVDIPLQRWELNDMSCNNCHAELILDIPDSFAERPEDKMPVKLDGKWCCPQCRAVLPAQEKFYLPAICTDREWY